MKNANAFLLFVAMFVLFNTVYAGEFEITGYKTGISSLDDSQEAFLNIKMAEISKEYTELKLKSGDGNQVDLTVSITGFADQTGLRTKNEDVSKNRAEQVKQSLLVKFPKAVIAANWKGDQKDVKKATVRWEFTVQPVADISKQNILIPKPSSKSIMIIVASIMVFLLIAGTFIGLIAAKTRKLPTGPTKTDSQSIPKDASNWDVEVSFPRRFFSPKMYLVPVAKNGDGIWRSFVPQMGSNEFLFHKDPNALRRTLISCSSPQKIKFYRPVFKKLAKNGVIKIKTQKTDGRKAS